MYHILEVYKHKYQEHNIQLKEQFINDIVTKQR